MTSPQELSNFIWGVAVLIRDYFKRGHYQDVILPFTVLRRIDCVLEPTKAEVLKKHADPKIKKLKNPDPQLCRASGYAFYNTSKFTFEKLLQDAPAIGDNLRAYINGFSPNMREVLERFDFPNTIAKLEEAGLLYKVMQRFHDVDLHPDVVPNHLMGQVFEDLIRRFNEALDENPGEHFTPREIVGLMVQLLVVPDGDLLAEGAVTRTVYDPACGSGGMLTAARECLERLAPGIQVALFGQEVNPQTWAITKSDLFMLSEDGRDAENIARGSTLRSDQHSDQQFDYLITNPPYGKDWSADDEAVRREHDKGPYGRFPAGLPRKSDGQMLFLQHLLAKMKPIDTKGRGGSRAAIVMNGSPLFTGDAGSGESEIRRWILENDLLEAIVALPEQIFYNTGIATYIWVLTNRKAPERADKVQLINATDLWEPMRRSLGDKRRRIADEQIEQIRRLHKDFRETERTKIFPTHHFAFRKVTIDRPLRLRFAASAERVALLNEQRSFQSLATSKKKKEDAREAEEAEGREKQDAIRSALASLDGRTWTHREAFDADLDAAMKEAGVKLTKTLRRAVHAALGERDEAAAVCRNGNGPPEHDSELRDQEQVPWGEDVDAYFEREVRPYVADAWVNTDAHDEKDGKVGVVGYEINFNREFYRYEPPRPLEEIDAEIRTLEGAIVEMLGKIMAGASP